MLRITAGKTACALLCCTIVALVQGTAGPAQAARSRNVHELLKGLDRAAARLQDYEVKGVTDTNGKRRRFTKYYKRPNLVRIDTRRGQVSVQPNGDIRGRLGHGLFGGISQKLNRNDRRLKDDEGIAFYNANFPALVVRIERQIRSGAAAAMVTGAGQYYLTIRSGNTIWRYTFDRSSLMLLRSRRWVNGKPVDLTHYSVTRANIGLRTGLFHF